MLIFSILIFIQLSNKDINPKTLALLDEGYWDYTTLTKKYGE